MKRIATSVGLVALGASVLHAADAGALAGFQTSKPWSASMSLRGFYDDNINSTENNKQGSFGFEVNPSVSVGVAGDRTSASVGYSYSGKYYQEKPSGNSSNWDHTHIFDAALQHAFSPRARLVVADSFVIGQEPDVLRVNNVVVGPQRISGANIRNSASIAMSLQVTELLGLEVGYANGLFDYDDEGAAITGTPAAGVVTQASRSGILDRLEHSAHIDTRWHFAPQTVGILGYMYAQTDYTGDEFVQGDTTGAVIPPIPFSTSDSRNSRSHFIYGGVEHSFSPDLSGSLRAGVQFVNFYKSATDSISPYFEGSLKYSYAAESHVDIGFSHRQSATDFVGFTSVVTDADTTVAYGSVTHRIAPRLFGMVIGTFQYATFNGGGVGANNQNDRFLLFGTDLSYRFNQHLSAHVGYNFDLLDSDIAGRDFMRNRVYLGMTADY